MHGWSLETQSNGGLWSIGSPESTICSTTLNLPDDLSAIDFPGGKSMTFLYNWWTFLRGLARMTVTKNHIVYVPDEEAMQILGSVPSEKRDQFINQAIKAWKSSAVPKIGDPAKSPSAGGGTQDPISQELGRIFGNDKSQISATAIDSDGRVKLLNTTSNQTITCVSQEIMDVLKSLRPPITQEEVWDLLCAFKV